MQNGTHLDKRRCLVTGLDISSQRAGSFLLAVNEIRRLYYTNRMSFNIIKNKYLSKKWINENLETQFFEIYHNIRNTASNHRIKQKRLYPPHQQNLF